MKPGDDGMSAARLAGTVAGRVGGATGAASVGADGVSFVSIGSIGVGAGASGAAALISATYGLMLGRGLTAFKVKMPKLHTATSMDTMKMSICEALLAPC